MSQKDQSLKISEDKKKKESLDRLVQQYYQAITDGNTKQIKILETILKCLGYNKFKK